MWLFFGTLSIFLTIMLILLHEGMKVVKINRPVGSPLGGLVLPKLYRLFPHWYFAGLRQFVNLVVDVVAKVRHVTFVGPKIQ